MGAGPWIESEDDVLRREYARQCIDSTSSTIRWDAIAHHLPGRTSRDVRKRWVNVLQNQFNKGAWTKDEDHRLRVAVQQYGTRWVSVAKDVDTRSADQCSKRWNQHLDPALVHSQWTEDEIELLFRAVSFHGTNWSTIQQVHFPRCPSNNIKNQHAIVSRNYDRLQGVLASISDAIPCCQNRGSSSQSSTPLSPKLMLPMSDNNLPNTQSLPWSPAPSEPACEYDTTGLGLHRSEYSSSQLDVLCSSLLSESNSTYSTLFDPLASEEITDTSGSLDQDVSLADSGTSALMPREVSLIIRNPNENLVTYLVQQLVTAKVDFKVVQRSN